MAFYGGQGFVHNRNVWNHHDHDHGEHNNNYYRHNSTGGENEDGYDCDDNRLQLLQLQQFDANTFNIFDENRCHNLPGYTSFDGPRCRTMFEGQELPEHFGESYFDDDHENTPLTGKKSKKTSSARKHNKDMIPEGKENMTNSAPTNNDNLKLPRQLRISGVLYKRVADHESDADDDKEQATLEEERMVEEKLERRSRRHKKKETAESIKVEQLEEELGEMEELHHQNQNNGSTETSFPRPSPQINYDGNRFVNFNGPRVMNSDSGVSSTHHQRMLHPGYMNHNPFQFQALPNPNAQVRRGYLCHRPPNHISLHQNFSPYRPRHPTLNGNGNSYNQIRGPSMEERHFIHSNSNGRGGRQALHPHNGRGGQYQTFFQPRNHFDKSRLGYQQQHTQNTFAVNNDITSPNPVVFKPEADSQHIPYFSRPGQTNQGNTFLNLLKIRQKPNFSVNDHDIEISHTNKMNDEAEEQKLPVPDEEYYPEPLYGGRDDLIPEYIPTAIKVEKHLENPDSSSSDAEIKQYATKSFVIAKNQTAGGEDESSQEELENAVRDFLKNHNHLKLIKPPSPPPKLEVRDNFYYIGDYLQVYIYGYCKPMKTEKGKYSPVACYGVCFKKGNTLNCGGRVEAHNPQTLVAAELLAAEHVISLAKNKIGHNILNIKTTSTYLLANVANWKNRINSKNVQSSLTPENWVELKHVLEIQRLCNSFTGMRIQWTLIDPEVAEDIQCREIQIAKNLSMSVQ